MLVIESARAPGRTLREWMKSGRLSKTASLAIADKMARILDEFHKLGIVHRDLQPENILVELENEKVKTITIIDFGLACVSYDSSLPCTRNAGMVDYQWPEYLRYIASNSKLSSCNVKIPRKVLIQNDNWSLLVLLYEMLTGENPAKAPLASHIVRGNGSNEFEWSDALEDYWQWFTQLENVPEKFLKYFTQQQVPIEF